MCKLLIKYWRYNESPNNHQYLDLEAYKTADIPTLELRKQLMAIKEVGPYAAANLLLLLGHYDFIPVNSWALKMVSHEWYNDEPVSKVPGGAGLRALGSVEGAGLLAVELVL